MENKKYLISGSSGFIGTALCKRLEADGHTVIRLSREHFYKSSWTYFFHHNRPDIVIHLASYGNHYDQKDLISIINANIIGTITFMKESEGIPFYNFSSSSVTLENQTAYSITKMCSEMIGNLFFNVINIRPYSVFGEGEASHRFIPTVIRSLNSGKQIELDEKAMHDWIYIDDFINAFLDGYTEIGTGESYSNLYVVKKLEEFSGKKLNYIPSKLRSYDTENWICKKGVIHQPFDSVLFKTYQHYAGIE